MTVYVKNNKEVVVAGAILLMAIFLTGILMFGTAPIMSVFADIASTTVSVGNAAPTVDTVTFNGGNNITLSENTFVLASTTVTVSDGNGCDNITSVEATLYRTAIATDGTTCTADDNNCYEEFIGCTATTTGNTCGASPDVSGEFDCSFRIWYIADPTDATAPNTSDIWAVAATATDASAGTGTATNTGETIEVNSLAALDVDPTIAYGSVPANSDTGATNQIATTTNTGNRSLDTDLGGDVMCTDWNTCSGGVMQPGQQEYATTTFTYGQPAGQTLTATASPTTVVLDLPKPTATTTAVEDPTYWGIAVPNGQTAGSYEGQNVFTANADD